ncbi:bifunctional 1-(5-phosphoribosyl)-5-((5-phosphoribosylamino)methylideneamino)imidazole-4-carboxamide isomerase/phosphoribosylanthranilate isomerase PriA [Stackebrandtia soli]|uniref:bifunctional 1-(5-phosphoribosyl)-5-((5- phosphoribosylamino)methylideneamino)imidazole-4- carboxamide isomerase/phosphoribosylanthranilate isomerase PriA n=1 Tax=Stackebrandtia soli TaxID=1892856 RepID=UPI0039E7676D
MSTVTLFPAVDIVAGKAVQLVQGVSGSGKEYGDPVAAARRWHEQGARWLHVVDLDAAFGRGDNAAAIAAISAAVDVRLEVSGGIRDDASLRRALDAGAARVNIGTAAIEKPQWCDAAIAAHGERIAVGLDVRGDRLAAHGWTTDGDDLLPVLARLDAAGCARYVVTDVASDGMLAGPNLDLWRRVADHTDAPIIASGGVTTLDDLRVVATLPQVEGVIVGTALYEGRFGVAEALGVLAEAR